MKIEIDVYEYVNHILTQLKKGILITTKVDEKVNPMTISWGQIGIEWNRLIFTTFVRTGRFTHHMLEKQREFTVNIPMGGKVSKILGFCGTKSGKEYDKIEELNLTLVEGSHIDVPAIKELPLTLECKVIYTQLQEKTSIPDELKPEFYPEAVPSDYHGANRDFHTMFIGEIVGAYIVE